MQGLARAPIDTGYLLKNDFEAAALVAFDQPLSDEWRNPEQIVAALERDPARRDHIDIGSFERGFWWQSGRTAAWCLTLLPKLVVTPLFLDGLGNTAWRTMRHRAFNSGRPSEEFEEATRGVSPEAAAERLDPTPTGGLALLMGELGRRIQNARARAPTSDPKMVAMRATALADEIIYMAPACSVAEAARSLVPFLKRANSEAAAKGMCAAPGGCGGAGCEMCKSLRRRKTNFWLLTLHPLAEAGEMYTEFADLPARGSLLEWIDDWYTSASHPLDRMFGKWNNAIPALHLFEPVKEHFNAKAFGVKGDSLPQRHGDFNDCPFWKQEFWDPEGTRWVEAQD
ncbi:MAG: hypothetical protein EXS13_07695 [Planctomycetes bacterium]|nr:hypothetical protein [Planctomycetota bacterium]